MEKKIPGISCDDDDNTDDGNSGNDDDADDDSNGDDEYWSKFCFKTCCRLCTRVRRAHNLCHIFNTRMFER